MNLLRAYLIDIDGEFSFRVSRQHPQTIRHNLRKQGLTSAEIEEVHQAELRALRVLPEALMSDLGAELIHTYDEQAKS